jgi:tight adherence protein B
MYISDTVLIFSISVLIFVLFLLCIVLYLTYRQNMHEKNNRYRSLNILPVNLHNDDTDLQNVALQRALRARLSEVKKNEKGGLRANVNKLLLRSGSKYNFKTYLVYSVAVYVVSIVVIFALSSNVLISVFSAIIPGLFGQNFFLAQKVKRRQKQFTADFAGALDIIVRGVTVGLSINESMKTVAYEAQGPVAEEFKRIVDSQAMGIEFSDTLTEAIDRMPTPEFQFFSIVMQIQRQTGGSMAKTLADLSSLLRGRKQMRDKILSLSSEAKSSAKIIGCLPFGIAGMIYLVAPDFLNPLFETTIGYVMIGAALGLMLVGMLVMRAMTDLKI